MATAVALPGGWDTRLAFVLGWVLMLGVALVPRGGGYLIASDAAGYALLALGLVLLLFAIVTVRPLRPEESEETGEAGPSDRAAAE